MMTRSPLLAIALSLLIALTGQSLAVARGAAAPVEQMVLCIGGGTALVYVDAQGQPTEAPRYCPDAALSALALALEAMPQGTILSVASVIAVPVPPRLQSTRFAGVPRARAPPGVSI